MSSSPVLTFSRVSPLSWSLVLLASGCSAYFENSLQPRSPASQRTGAEGGSAESSEENPYLNRVIRPLPAFRLATVSPQVERPAVNSTYQYLLGQLFANEGRNEEAARAFENAQRHDPKSSHLQLALSQEYLKKGWVAEGISLLKGAIRIDPKNKEAKALLANMLSSARKYSEAYVLLEEVVADNPDDEESLLLLVLLDIELKNPSKAEQRLRKMTHDNPDSALAHFYLGRLLQEKNRNREALGSYKKAVELRAGFVQAGTYLGALQESLGDKEGALDTYTWLAGQTDSASFHKKLGQLQLEKNQFEKALQSFENLERIEPGDLSNKIRLGLLYMQLHKLDLAMAMFKQALKKNPEAETLRVYLANIYEQNGKESAAIDEYARISEKDPKVFSEALKRRLYLLAKLSPSRAEKVWQDFKLKRDLDQTWTVELYSAGILMFDAAQNYDRASALVTESLKTFPKEENLMYLRAMMLEKSGDWQRGIAAMKELLALNPHHASALNFIGYVWADHGVELLTAEKFIRKSIKLRPTDALVKDSLGWVLFKRGKWKEAREVLLEARAKEPKESIIAEHLGDVLVKLGDFDEAKKAYETSLQLGPDTAEAKDHLQEKVAALRRGQPLDPCEAWSKSPLVSVALGGVCNTARVYQPSSRSPTSARQD